MIIILDDIGSYNGIQLMAAEYHEYEQISFPVTFANPGAFHHLPRVFAPWLILNFRKFSHFVMQRELTNVKCPS